MASLVFDRAYLRRMVKPVYDGLRSVIYYPRARKILDNYARHYHEARSLFLNDQQTPPFNGKGITEIDVLLARPLSRDTPLELSGVYLSHLKRLHAAAAEQFRYVENCLFFPKLQGDRVTGLTETLPAVRGGEIIALQLKDPLKLDGLTELCQCLVPQLERNLYGSHVLVDKVYLYRNLISHSDEQVSWTWHYDNHPKQIHKVMIYLTDVDELSGPFEYLRSSRTGKPFSMDPTPLAGYGRVSASWINRRLSEGYESHKVVGPSGTVIVFDQNIVHKANIAKGQIRDALVLQMRPCTFTPASYVDPTFTGSFEHCDFNTDPYDYRAHRKRNMVSG